MRFLMSLYVFCFFLNDTATTEIYTLSLHDALPISSSASSRPSPSPPPASASARSRLSSAGSSSRSEEHTSELQSRENLVCRLLLEKKKNYIINLFKNIIIKSNI